MPEKRNWKEYNEHLIRRGEILFSLDFLEKWDEIEKMNKGKRGRPYEYPESFAVFMKILHDCIHIRYFIIAVDSSNRHIGISIGPVNATVENCYVAGNMFGIDIVHLTGKVLVRYNTVVNNTYGIYVFGRCYITINYNNIYDNEFGLKAEFTIVDASYNYWGSPLGPSILFNLRGDKIETFFAKVIYFPWLTEEYEQ